MGSLPGGDRTLYFACFARPLVLRVAPRPRAALPLAPAERLPVSFEKASMTLPAILSTVPSALSRDPDFITPVVSHADSLSDSLSMGVAVQSLHVWHIGGPAQIG
jgi:hypothetical protein